MYVARDDKIYVVQTDIDNGKEHLFLTVHPTDTGNTMTVAQQAQVIAEVLNEL